MKKYLLTFLIVVGVSVLVISSVVATGKIVNENSTGGGSPKDNLTQEQVGKFMEEGFNDVDIYTAQSLSRKLNISISDLLKEKDRGLTWPEVINKLAPDVTLKREDDTGEKPPKIDKDKVKELQGKGYDLNDIADAFTLAWRYDKTVDDVLNYQKNQKKKWQDVDSDFAKGKHEKEKEKKEKEKKNNKIISFVDDNEKDKKDKKDKENKFQNGPTVDEVNKYLDKGYEIKDVQRAYAIAIKYDLSVDNVLKKQDTAKNWGEVISQLAGKKSTEASEKQKPNVKEFNYANERQINPDQSELSKSGLTVDQINYLLEKYPAEDVFAADSLAEKYGLDVEKALILKESGKNWREIIVSSTPYDISMSLDDVKTRYDLDTKYINSLLNNYDLKLSDIMVAGELSIGTKKSFQQVIELRLSLNSWQEVYSKLGIQVKELPSNLKGGS